MASQSAMNQSLHHWEIRDKIPGWSASVAGLQANSRGGVEARSVSNPGLGVVRAYGTKMSVECESAGTPLNARILK